MYDYDRELVKRAKCKQSALPVTKLAERAFCFRDSNHSKDRLVNVCFRSVFAQESRLIHVVFPTNERFMLHVIYVNLSLYKKI